VQELTREFIAESQEGLERMELCLTELEKRPNDGELVAEIFRTVHTIKGTTGFLGFSRLQTLAHTGESVLAALRDGKIGVTPALISGLLALLDRLRAILRLIEETGAEGERSTDDDAGLSSNLVELRTRDAQLPIPESAAAVPRVVEQADALPTSAEAPASQRRTLRIDVEVLNRLMNQVGELVLTRNHILQSEPGAENFAELARRLNNVTGELRETVMQARMQPAGHLFGKFPRMVRDLARTCGRQARIEFEGQETELDKSLLEAIRDPLTHAVRNAVDHGIEPPEERMRAGKPAEGLVRLRAFHRGGWVVVEVIDDGAGIATERVLAKAVERGYVTPERAASMSQHEALQMIFVAGFSTATKVTSVSGRGVGMDVVRANLEKVGGNVELESRAGFGTTVRMRVPLTLAIVSALVVRSGGQNFVLPQSSLVELVYVPRRDRGKAVERVGEADLYRLRESLLPLVWLDRLLGLEQGADAEVRDAYVAVLEAGGRRFGLVVDGLKAPEEIVVKPLSAALREIGMFSGATVLGNGVLALILDAAAMGVRAGVRPAADAGEISGGPKSARAGLKSGMESSMVIYETWKRRTGGMDRGAQMALPLSAGERIERVSLNQIEWADGHAVLQYGGELLPLEDVEEAMTELGADALATILICQRPGVQPKRRVGMAVRRVLDVSEGTLLAANADLPGGQLAMAKSRVTTVHREFVGQLELQEVA
jgi:two-component system chemotaxis sensor kinase CheA